MKNKTFKLIAVGATISLSFYFLFMRKSISTGDPTVMPHPQSEIDSPHTYVGQQEQDSAKSIASFSRHHLSVEDVPEGAFCEDLKKLPSVLQEEVLILLSDDQSLWADIEALRIDPGGALYYVCSFTPTPQAKMQEASIMVAEEVAGAVESAGAAIPISTPITLHSRPGSANILFLDFDGHVIEGTAWNLSRGVARWDCLPYNKEGDSSTFSTSELTLITQIWERVSEDYAPFDVDVTTEQPSVWTSTTGHALITPGVDANGTNCPHASAGGVAYLNKFGQSNYSYYSPAWCKDYNESSTAEVVSHELGHNLSLAHDGWNDGTTNITYYSGHETGSIDWSPIMGVSYGDDVTQWSKGEYLYANNAFEDDLADMAILLGYRSDDAGDSNATASPLGSDLNGLVTYNGVIQATDDPDVFSFSTGAGNITITASSYRAATSTWGGNLDILLELYDSGGALVATNNPELDVNATLALSVAAGSYFLHVKPVGVGSPMANPPTGYTVYGSLGQYWLTGMVQTDADGDGIPNEWEVLYFGGFTNAVATADPDGDGSDNYSEYVAGTVPNDSNSVFKVVTYAPPATGSNAPFVVTWNPVAGRIYNVGWTYNLVYIPFSDISGDLPYTANSYTDSVDRTGLQNFYRVDVRLDQ